MFVSPSPCSIPSTLEMLRERIRGLLHMRTSHRVAKEVLKRGGYIRLSADFLAEVLQVRKEKDDIFTMLKEKTANQEGSVQQSCLSQMNM